MKNKFKLYMISVMLVCMLVCTGIALYKGLTEQRVVKNLGEDRQIIFAADLREGGRGTYVYTVSDSTLHKLSEDVFHNLSFFPDSGKLVGVLNEERYQGLAEYRMEESETTILLNAEELRHYFPDPVVFEGREDILKIKGIQPVDEGILFDYMFNVYQFSVKDKKKELERVYDGTVDMRSYIPLSGGDSFIVGTFRLDGKYRIDKNYTDGSHPKFICYGGPLMACSKDGSTLVYMNQDRIYRRAMEKRKAKELDMHLPMLGEIKYLSLSADERYVAYLRKENAIIPFFTDTYKLYVADIHTGESALLQSWDEENEFYGLSW